VAEEVKSGVSASLKWERKERDEFWFKYDKLSLFSKNFHEFSCKFCHLLFAFMNSNRSFKRLSFIAFTVI
jgi:hypothetical protein